MRDEENQGKKQIKKLETYLITFLANSEGIEFDRTLYVFIGGEVILFYFFQIYSVFKQPVGLIVS